MIKKKNTELNAIISLLILSETLSMNFMVRLITEKPQFYYAGGPDG